MNFINTQIVKAQAAVTMALDSLTSRENGQAMVEYGLVLVLVSVVAIVGLTAIGGDLYNPAITVNAGPPPAMVIPATQHAGVFNQIIFALSGGKQAA